jgi:hypothetical protein
MSIWKKLRLGDGTLEPDLVSALRAEGLVLCEEGLPATIRYEHFRAPGRRMHGKVTRERVGLAISDKRFAVYCRSGSVKLADSEFGNPRLRVLEVSLDGENAVSLRIDYARQSERPNVSGVITIHVTTPSAPRIVDELRGRLAP